MFEDDSGWRLEQKMENEIFNFAFLPDECTIFLWDIGIFYKRDVFQMFVMYIENSLYQSYKIRSYGSE